VTLPDKLFLVELVNFQPEYDDDTRLRDLENAKTDCRWLNGEEDGRAPTPIRFLSATLNDAMDLAVADIARRLRAPGYVSGSLRYAKFNPAEHAVPNYLFEAGRRVTIGTPRED